MQKIWTPGQIWVIVGRLVQSQWGRHEKKKKKTFTWVLPLLSLVAPSCWAGVSRWARTQKIDSGLREDLSRWAAKKRKKMKENVLFEVLLGRRASCLGQAVGPQLVGPSVEPALRLEEPSFWASAPPVGWAELLGPSGCAKLGWFSRAAGLSVGPT